MKPTNYLMSQMSIIYKQWVLTLAKKKCLPTGGRETLPAFCLVESFALKHRWVKRYSVIVLNCMRHKAEALQLSFLWRESLRQSGTWKGSELSMIFSKTNWEWRFILYGGWVNVVQMYYICNYNSWTWSDGGLWWTGRGHSMNFSPCTESIRKLSSF